MTELCYSCIHCSTEEEQCPLFCSENTETPHLHAHCSVRKQTVHPPGSCEDFRSRIEGDKEYEENRLTHEGVVDLCRRYAIDHKWQPFILSEVSHTIGAGTPDLLLWKQDVVIRALEIKPWKASRNEIRRGIGQCAYYLLHGFESYLVAPLLFKEELVKVFEELSVLGLIVYTKDGNLDVIQGKPF